MSFENGGNPTGRIVRKADSKRTGTTVTFWPDPTVFEETEFRAQTLIERLREMAFLNKGLEIRFKDERTDPVTEQNFLSKGGIVDFVKHLNSSKEPIFKRVVSFEETASTSEVEIAMQWNTGYYEGLHSFANNIATTEGGMHEEGFKKALTNAVNKYGRAHGPPQGEGRQPPRRGHPRGPHRDHLGEAAATRSSRVRPRPSSATPRCGRWSRRSTNEKLGDWLEEHPPEAKQIMTKATAASRARMAAKSARDLTRRKSALEGGGLPGKLADCSSRNPAESEMFIVEGNSAGSSAKDARDPHIQAILPIRGKILNVERARMDKMLKNIEIQALITAIGAGLAEDFDADKARYHRIIILADADVDGSHIRTLLLTFFFRQMPQLFERGYIYVAQPPLYSAVLGKTKTYLKDEAALTAFLAENEGRKPEIARLKGLGEMDFEELWETTMDPTQRTLLQVSVEQAAIADEVCSILMGDDVESRRGFIQQNAKDVRFLDI